MSEKLPNFLIVGMAKCGTSSLASYLQQHPDVFISSRKEPRFFTSQSTEIYPLNGPKDQAVMHWYVPDYENYCKLFEGADESMIGEASADTLYFYKYTIPLIKKYLDNPKIILIIRNPVKRAFSAFQYLTMAEREEVSFEEGLELEGERIKSNWELIYHYRSVGNYYEPIKAFMENFSNVKVIISDELLSKPREVLTECFNFLGVSGDFEVNTSMKLNPSGIPKSRLLYNMIRKESVIKKGFRLIIRLFFPEKKSRVRLSNKLFASNLKKISFSKNTEFELKEYYKEEILKVSKLIGKDLSGWLN